MQTMSADTGGAVAQRGRSRRHAAAAGLGAGIVAGSLAAAAVLAPVAGAATQAHKAAHKAAKTSGSSTTTGALAQIEKGLTNLEKKAPAGTTLSETGSTLFYPLFTEWAADHPLHLTVNPAGTGSGTGQASALNGTVNIGASDAYLPATDPPNLLNVPVVVSAQQINYNLPGFKPSFHLKLDAAILNGIYTGAITNWDDSAIAKLNKGVQLPNLTIVPLRRSDGSGDTFMFTSYIDFQDGPSSFVAQKMGGPNTSSTGFPTVAGEQSELGNTGMLQACEQIKGCIAYIGVSYLRSALSHGLGNAALLNGYDKKGSKGNFVQLNPGTIKNEVASFSRIPANGTLSLINSRSAPKGYPIVNFEYAIVNAHQPSSTTAAAAKALLAWGMDPRYGATPKYLSKIGFQPLAPNALKVAMGLLDKIH